MKEKVTAFITSLQLINPNDHIFVALSGGPDSVCLLHLLLNIRESLRFRLSALHINHNLRGDESDRDEQFCKQLCEQWSVPFFSETLKGFSLTSSEDDLRNARYAIFEKYLDTFSNSKIATAHHLNDQFETFIMRLAKGSGVKGLLGIPVIRERFIRPLLNVSQKEIKIYLEEKRLSFRVDSSNVVPDKLRNKIRVQLVPQFEQIFGEEFIADFYQSYQALKEVFSFFESQNNRLFSEIVQRQNKRIRIAVEAINALNDTACKLLAEYCFSYAYDLNFRVSLNKSREFKRFCVQSQTGTLFNFENGITVLKDRKNIIISKENEESGFSAELHEAQVVSVANQTITITGVGKKDIILDNNPNLEFICGDNLKFPLQVRTWDEGDFFFPLGMQKSQKLSDFFINNKIDRQTKKKILLILNNDEIIWVAGHRLDNRYKWNKSCKKVFRLSLL